MKTRYRLIRRGIRGNAFYCVDTKTGKRTSLGTDNEDDARQIIQAKKQSERQLVLNLQIAKAYLAGTDSGVSTPTWQDAFEILINNKHGSNQVRWKRAVLDKAFDLIRHKTIIETKSELLLKVLHIGTVSWMTVFHFATCKKILPSRGFLQSRNICFEQISGNFHGTRCA